MRNLHIVWVALFVLSIAAYKMMEARETDRLAAEHGGCKQVSESEGSHWATIGANGHPRIGASSGKERFRCADGYSYTTDRP